MKISWGSSNAGIRKEGFVKGIFLGLIVLAGNIGSFYYIMNMAKSSSVLILLGAYALTILIPLGAIVLFMMNARKKNGGYWSFKQAVTSAFIMFITSYVILTLGRDMLFAKLVEPNMASKIGKVMIDSRIAKDKAEGSTPDQINKDITEQKKNYNMQTESSSLPLIENIPENILMLFVLSIIFAAIFKKEPPLVVAEETIK